MTEPVALEGEGGTTALTYPRGYLRFALCAFYLFVAAGSFTEGYGAIDSTVRFAGFGAGSAALMWWVIDGTHRRAALPFMSLWVGYCWFVTLPVYILQTRPRAYAVRRIAMHAGFVLVAKFIGGIAGALIAPE